MILQWMWELCVCLFEILISFPLAVCPHVRLLDQKVILSSIFGGTSILFPIEALSASIPSSAHGFSPLHICAKTSFVFFLTAILTGRNGCFIVLQFAFSWWLMMLNIFSGICWSSVCHLLKNTYLCTLSIFNGATCSIFVLFCYWFVWVPYLFWILTPYQIHNLQIFLSSSIGCSFIVLMASVAVQKLSSLLWSHLGTLASSVACAVGIESETHQL